MGNITRNHGIHQGGFQSFGSGDFIKEEFPHLETGNTTEPWKIPDIYNTAVNPRSDPATFYLSATALGLVAISLVGIGGQVEGEECVQLVKKPLAVGIGMLSRFGVLPALTLGIVELIQPDRNSSIGILSLTCSPSEGASNLLVLLAEGDLTFSVTLASINNFATIALVPLWTILFETLLYSKPGNISIPFKDSFIVFCYIVTACLVGFLLHRKLNSLYNKLWMYLPGLTIVTLGFILIVEIYNNSYVFPLVTIKLFLVSILVASCGFIFGAIVAFLARLPKSRILVNCLDCGTRTTYITGILLETSLSGTEADLAKVAPVMCCIFSLLPALVCVILYRLHHQKNEEKSNDESGIGTIQDEEVSECQSGLEPPTELKETCI